MNLTGPQREQICNAILSGYDEPNLQRLVEFSLEQRLDQIASGGNLTDEVSELVRWAERKGYMTELVKAAVERNPKNPALQQLWQDFGEWDRLGVEAGVATGAASRAAGGSVANQGPWRLVALVAILGLVVLGGVMVARMWNGGVQPSTPPAEPPTESIVSTSPPEPAQEPTLTEAPQTTDAPQPTVAVDEAASATPMAVESAGAVDRITPKSYSNSAENKIGLGERGEGELFGSETNDWIFEGGPAAIDILLDTGPRSEAFVMVLGEDGTVIYDHDAQSGPEERLVNFQIPDDGTYTIAVRNTNNAPTTYTLTVTESAPPQPIGLNESVSGQFYGAEGIEWIFQDGPANITIVLRLENRGEALVILLDADGRELIYADNQSGLEERIVNFDIPDGEPYTILIRNAENRPAGYTLTVEGRSD